MYFVEKLTLGGWCVILPRLLWGRMGDESAPRRCYVINGSRVALGAAQACRWLTGVTIEPLQFSLRDIRDEDGGPVRFRIASQDLLQVQQEILEEPDFRDLLRHYDKAGRLPTYLVKTATASDLRMSRSLWRALEVIRVCAWKRQQEPRSSAARPICFLRPRPWLAVLQRYASRYDLSIVPVWTAVRVGDVVRRLFPNSMGLIRCVRSWVGYARMVLRSCGRAGRPSRTLLAAARGLLHGRPVMAGESPAPRIAVEYFGLLNLEQPERYSDLFFWHASSMAAKDLLAVFTHAHDPLDEATLPELVRHGVAAVALQPEATTIPSAPVFFPRRWRSPAPVQADWFRSKARGPDVQWLRGRVREYQGLRRFWTEFFARYQVKVFVSWFKYTATHCAIADALQSLGGVTAIYQRAYECVPFGEMRIAVDIVFGFAPGVAELERRSHSVIPYHVTTGYLGDHRFRLLRAPAQLVRQALCRRGAKRILGFADENTVDDPRWSLVPHEVERLNYAFLLEQVLREPWLGLVLKPKRPGTLRRRLGPVAELLARAEATGRCYVFEAGARPSAFPPAIAALGCDVMIHGHLDAATAGLEAALAGVPTLLLDREGWTANSLYRLGVGRAIFTDWEHLWQACLDHWQQPNGSHGFGDWSPMLEELDPFRDGRAAERMGTYLQWLLEGFKAGRDRDGAMADAAERYAARWGHDKITHVNCRPRQPLPASAVEAGAGRHQEIPA